MKFVEIMKIHTPDIWTIFRSHKSFRGIHREELGGKRNHVLKENESSGGVTWIIWNKSSGWSALRLFCGFLCIKVVLWFFVNMLRCSKKFLAHLLFNCPESCLEIWQKANYMCVNQMLWVTCPGSWTWVSGAPEKSRKQLLQYFLPCAGR